MGLCHLTTSFDVSEEDGESGLLTAEYIVCLRPSTKCVMGKEQQLILVDVILNFKEPQCVRCMHGVVCKVHGCCFWNFEKY